MRSSVSAIHSPHAPAGTVSAGGIARRASAYDVQPASPPAIVAAQAVTRVSAPTIANSFTAPLNPLRGIFHPFDLRISLALSSPGVALPKPPYDCGQNAANACDDLDHVASLSIGSIAVRTRPSTL